VTAATFERIANFRDVGGHPTRDGGSVRSGVLFRCGHLAHATDGDIEKLEALGVRTVIDLRATVETTIEGASRLPDGATLVHIPMGDVRAGENIRELLGSGDVERITRAFPPGAAREMMLAGARAFVVADEHRAAFSEVVRVLVEAGNTPAIVHCSAGKDRTGWAVALVLLAVGVAEERVVADYLRSNESLGARMANLARTTGGRFDAALLEPLVLVHEDYIATSLAALEEEWGGIDGYLTAGLGIDGQLRSRLRAVFVDGQPSR
jgi:protein-tyrosine phosphatase